MSLKDEMREAAAVEMDKRCQIETARAIRSGGNTYYVAIAVNAALSVCDEYEEVEVQVPGTNPNYLRTHGSPFWDHDKPSFTVYRKKEKLEPALEELVRRAVKAWREPQSGLGATMTALAEAVDK